MLLVAGFAAATAMAESTVTACLPYVKTTGKLATGKPIVAGTETGTCKDTTAIHYHSLNIPEAGGFEKLNKLLSHVTFNESGVGGKPTVQFSGVNVQIINGEGSTESTNGAGNLVLGYDEEPGAQTGSHDLMLGSKQAYTSYGSILGGWKNTASGPRSVVLGENNLAEAEQAEVLGGGANQAIRFQAEVLGGSENAASGTASVIVGGRFNAATKIWADVGGGYLNTAAGEQASVSGGQANVALGTVSSVSGGQFNLTEDSAEWIGGGYNNTTKGSASWSSVFGGKELKATNPYEAIP
jgi:hypothetical protein